MKKKCSRVFSFRLVLLQARETSPASFRPRVVWSGPQSSTLARENGSFSSLAGGQRAERITTAGSEKSKSSERAKEFHGGRKKKAALFSYRHRRSRSRRRRGQRAQRAPGCGRAGHVCKCAEKSERASRGAPRGGRGRGRRRKSEERGKQGKEGERKKNALSRFVPCSCSPLSTSTSTHLQLSPPPHHYTSAVPSQKNASLLPLLFFN